MEPEDRYKVYVALFICVALLLMTASVWGMTGLWFEPFATACGLALVFRAYML